jgi:hypothetical protein
VLLLLYADQNGDLRAVLTIRAKTLSSCEFRVFSFLLLCFSYYVIDFNNGYHGIVSMAHLGGLWMDVKPQSLVGLR